MNHQLTGFLCSLFVHAAMLGVVCCLSSGYASEPKPVTIDLSLLETIASLPEGGSAPPADLVPPVKEPPRARPIEPSRKAAPKSRPVKKSKLAAPSHLFAPAVKDAGPAQTAAVPNLEALPEAQSGPGSEVTACSGGAGNCSGSGTGSGPGGRGSGSHGTAADPASRYLAEHFAYIKERIQKNITYPRRARKMGWQGTVVVSFIVQESGRACDVTIVQSSGYPILDNNAIGTIHDVQPFPKPPAVAKLNIPITYRLQ